MSKIDKILTSEYLDWHVKLSGLLSILMDKIYFNLYKNIKEKLDISHGNYQKL